MILSTYFIIWRLTLDLRSVLVGAFKASGLWPSTNVSWFCYNFLLTLLDLPFSIMAISISVSNQPAGKSQCSPSAVSLVVKRIPGFVFALFDATKFVYIEQPVCDSLILFRSALMAPSRSVPVSIESAYTNRVSKNNDRCCALSVMLYAFKWLSLNRLAYFTKRVQTF